MAKINKTICDLCGEEFIPEADETWSDGSPIDPDDSVFDVEDEDQAFMKNQNSFVKGVRAEANKGNEDICEACYEKIVTQATKAVEKTRENIKKKAAK